MIEVAVASGPAGRRPEASATHLHIREWGTGRRMIALHGLGASGEQIRAMWPADGGRSVIAPDLPGHGRSSPDTYSFDSFADLIGALVRRVSRGPIDLLGVSMGCGVALTLALSSPRSVRSLVLVRPAWLAGPAEPQLDLVARVGAWLQDEHGPSALHHLSADPDYLSLAAAQPLAAASVRALLRRGAEAPSPVALTAMVADRPFASLAKLREIDVPAVVVGNNRDRLHPVAVAEALAGALPRSRYVLAPSRYEEPDAHFAAIRTAASQLHAGRA